MAVEESLSIEDVTNDQGVKGLRATFQLEASREAIWDLLTDYDRFLETFTRISSLEVINEDDQGSLQDLGIGRLFGPGTPTGEAVAYIKEWAEARESGEGG